MLGLLAPTLIAAIAALAMGGSLHSLFSSGIRGWPAIIVAFAAELLVYNPPVNSQPWAIQIGPWIWLITQLVFLAVLVTNGWFSRDGARWPFRLAALGVASNVLVIALNGGHMPQSVQAALAVWGSSDLDASRLQNVARMDVDTRLAWLADVFPEPTWLPRRNVVSVGDILLALGIASWVFRAATTSVARGRLARATIGDRIPTPIDGPGRPRRGAAR
jgi:hypothetical protein